jgi:hypothetical protein
MLASPFLVGALAAGLAWIHVPLGLFWLAGYLAFFASALWLKSGRRARWFAPARFYVLLAVALGLLVALLQPALLRWAPAFAVPLGVGLWAAAARHERDLLAGLTTVVASGLITVVAYDAGASGSLDRGAQLAAVQFLYFAGTVFYVKTVIRERDNPAFLKVSVTFHIAATCAVAWLSWRCGDQYSWLLVVVFAALTARSALVPGHHPSPKQVGIAEIVATVVVAVTSLLTL